MVKITFDVPKKMMDLAKTPGVSESPYDLCLECPFRGETCDGPNGLAMTMDRWVRWNANLAKQKQITRANISELSGIPLATVNSIMTGRTEDPRHSTMKALSKAYSGGCWGQYPCHFAALLINDKLPEDDGEAEELSRELRQAKAELEEAKEKLSDLSAKYRLSGEQMRSAVAEAKEEGQRKVDFLKEQIHFKDTRMLTYEQTIRKKERVTTILSVILGILVSALLITLLYDALNPDIGYFRY